MPRTSRPRDGAAERALGETCGSNKGKTQEETRSDRRSIDALGGRVQVAADAHEGATPPAYLLEQLAKREFVLHARAHKTIKFKRAQELALDAFRAKAWDKHGPWPVTDMESWKTQVEYESEVPTSRGPPWWEAEPLGSFGPIVTGRVEGATAVALMVPPVKIEQMIAERSGARPGEEQRVLDTGNEMTRTTSPFALLWHPRHEAGFSTERPVLRLHYIPPLRLSRASHPLALPASLPTPTPEGVPKRSAREAALQAQARQDDDHRKADHKEVQDPNKQKKPRRGRSRSSSSSTTPLPSKRANRKRDRSSSSRSRPPRRRPRSDSEGRRADRPRAKERTDARHKSPRSTPLPECSAGAAPSERVQCDPRAEEMLAVLRASVPRPRPGPADESSRGGSVQEQTRLRAASRADSQEAAATEPTRRRRSESDPPRCEESKKKRLSRTPHEAPNPEVPHPSAAAPDHGGRRGTSQHEAKTDEAGVRGATVHIRGRRTRRPRSASSMSIPAGERTQQELPASPPAIIDLAKAAVGHAAGLDANRSLATALRVKMEHADEHEAPRSQMPPPTFDLAVPEVKRELTTVPAATEGTPDVASLKEANATRLLRAQEGQNAALAEKSVLVGQAAALTATSVSSALSPAAAEAVMRLADQIRAKRYTSRGLADQVDLTADDDIPMSKAPHSSPPDEHASGIVVGVSGAEVTGGCGLVCHRGDLRWALLEGFPERLTGTRTGFFPDGGGGG